MTINVMNVLQKYVAEVDMLENIPVFLLMAFADVASISLSCLFRALKLFLIK